MQNYYDEALWSRREELAEKVKATDVEDPEAAKEDDSAPSEEELKAQAANLSLKELAENLQLVKDLLEDPEEDISDEERKDLTEAYLAGVEKINKEQGTSSEENLCTESAFEFVHMCWGRPCGQNTKRRLKSVTPGGVLDTIKKKGTGKPSQYQYGKYNFDFIPTTLGEAKHKRRKAYTSLTRWRAAALLFAVPALLPGIKNPAIKKMKERKKDHRVAKGQLYRQKLKAKGTGTSAASELREALVARMEAFNALEN